MMKKQLLTLLSIIAVAFLLQSCGKELSRSKAKELIISDKGLPYDETVRLPKKYYVRQYNEGGWLPAVGLWGGEKYSDEKDKLDMLLSQGVITLEDIDERLPNGLHWVYKEIRLTEEGKKYLTEENEETLVMRSCTIDFGEVTGIQTDEQYGASDVHYTLVRKNITPFGQHLSQDPIDKLANFSLYDDGWRIGL